MDFLTIFQARSPRSMCKQYWFLPRVLSLACRLLYPHCVLIWFFLYAHTSLISLFSSSFKDLIHVRLGTTFMTSFTLNYLFKDLLSKYTYILRYWGLALQHINFEIQPITVLIFVPPNPVELRIEKQQVLIKHTARNTKNIQMPGVKDYS